MGQLLDALLQLQSVERQLSDVRRRLRTRQLAVATQQKRIDQFHAEQKELEDRSKLRRKEADNLELDLKTRQQQVDKLRAALNAAKTNKEYAAILTQINSLKADNAKQEEDGLKILQEVEAIKTQAAQAAEKVAAEEKRLAEIQASNTEQIAKLQAMTDQLNVQRAESAKGISPEVLSIFERLALSHGGEAMAPIEVHGKRPPHDYVCGGCFMALRAEHANALHSRDEVRTCDNCGRILYLVKDPQAQRNPV